jgi:hypothetical protein
MLLPLPRIGSVCWTRKKGERTFTANRRSKSSTVVSSMFADFATPAFATKNVQPVANDKAVRLRARLATYYSNEGSQDPLVIELPKGGYVPIFRHSEAAPGRPCLATGLAPDDVGQPMLLPSLEGRHNLPIQRTPLIGREKLLSAATRRLLRQDVRLVTFTGPGGTGKTRLALQAAEEVLEYFAGGVYFVPLASIADPALVVPSIAQTLGVRETTGKPLIADLKEHLPTTRTLRVSRSVLSLQIVVSIESRPTEAGGAATQCRLWGSTASTSVRYRQRSPARRPAQELRSEPTCTAFLLCHENGESRRLLCPTRRSQPPPPALSSLRQARRSLALTLVWIHRSPLPNRRVETTSRRWARLARPAEEN